MDKRLPPLNAIRAFEVAARHLSFVRAAQELGVTQSAVSKQIHLLEDFIGAQLFDRLPGSLALTLEGRALRDSVYPAFRILEESFQRFSRKPPRSKVIRLATVASFASQFLVPRLVSFAEQFPDIELELLTSDRVVDLTKEEVDLSIRYGAGEWDGLISRELVKGELIPVCAPRLLDEKEQNIDALVATNRLIQVFAQNEWNLWETESGVALPKVEHPFIIEHFMVAAKAAIGGHGLALLPRLIVQEYLTKDVLVEFSEPIDWHHSFSVTHLPNAEKNPTIQMVIDWLFAEAA